MTAFAHRSISRQTLLMDADDTLWENNIYFEQAIASFITYLNHHKYTREQVREELNRAERETIREHGYGLTSFRRSLVACFEHLSTEPITEEKHARILSFAQAIADREIELLEGVREALPNLASRHQLILMTKGHRTEQADKFARSGISEYFSAVEIPREKDTAAYVDVCRRHNLNYANTWMIGNSPRSDINPALAAGLHAVLVHHPHTWILEHEAVNPAPQGQRFLELSGFASLLEHF
ncbi:MAG TPA: HAD hydrolase-like protein [Acidisarcina sp.]|nr:HAD hydrolase-like protein [Acidisarcina sp.]